MKTITRLLCIVVILSIPMALLAAKKDDGRSRDSYYDRPTDRGGERLTGSIRAADGRGHSLELDIGGRSQRVRLDDRSQVYSGSRRIDVDDLRKGDSVRIECRRSSGNEFIGLMIYLLARNEARNDARDDYRYDSRYGRQYQDSIQARVTRETGIFNRTLRVAALDGNRYRPTFDVDVLKDADVIKNGRRISVHEIRTGDVVEIEGRWRGSDFIASFVQVSDDWRANRSRDWYY